MCVSFVSRLELCVRNNETRLSTAFMCLLPQLHVLCTFWFPNLHEYYGNCWLVVVLPFYSLWCFSMPCQFSFLIYGTFRPA